ncbi:MAG: heavy-metal-associated domain-containing protein [Lachnospiraceae bacterium]
MKTFKCEEIMCDHCVSRIQTALNREAIKHSIDLASKTVTIDGNEACISQALEILDDLGFEAKEIAAR